MITFKNETSVLIKHIEKNLNQICQRYFEGNHEILSVTNSGDYVTVKRQGLFVGDFDTQKLFEALENFSQEEYELSRYGLWDYLDHYLDHCKYTPENQESGNKLSLSETARLNNWIKQLQGEYQELEKNFEILEEKNLELEQNKEYSQTWIQNLQQRVHDLECTIYLLQQENKRLKNTR